MRSLTQRRASVAVAVAVLAQMAVASACSPTAPSPPPAPNPGTTENPPTPPVPQPPPNAVVEGQVLDADRQQPISGVTVTTEQVGIPGAYVRPASPVSTVTDDAGRFVLNAVLPPDWRELLVGLVRSGYESTAVYTTRTGQIIGGGYAMYPTISLRPGDAIEISLWLGHYVCGFESWMCRRLLVESTPSGRLVDVEVSPLNSGQQFGLVVGDKDPAFFAPERLVTLPGGEVRVLGEGRVMVRTRWH
jgi:hypothetical protein